MFCCTINAFILHIIFFFFFSVLLSAVFVVHLVLLHTNSHKHNGNCTWHIGSVFIPTGRFTNKEQVKEKLDKPLLPYLTLLWIVILNLCSCFLVLNTCYLWLWLFLSDQPPSFFGFHCSSITSLKSRKNLIWCYNNVYLLGKSLHCIKVNNILYILLQAV